MSKLTPPEPDTHVVRVTREPRPDGGAVYTVTVDVNSEEVIASGAELEGVSPGVPGRVERPHTTGRARPGARHLGRGVSPVDGELMRARHRRSVAVGN